MKLKIYTLIDIANELNITPYAVGKRIRKMGIECIFKKCSTRYFNQSQFDIITKKSYKRKELFYPVYITSTYHIYESKINNEQ
jgi:DNA-binding Lrp family transcriptional regulator